MKLVSALKNKSIRVLFAVVVAAILPYGVNAQMCSNPSNTAYGLNSSGDILSINVATGLVSARLNPTYTGNAPSQPNGMGYSTVNGNFYFFKRNTNRPPQEFISFNAGTMVVTILASCPTTSPIHTGCITANGLGFYALDANGTLYYYNISRNTWRVITAAFFDEKGNNITSIISDQNSGDLAIDGGGNLWMLTSSYDNYALFKIKASSLPTTTVASIRVTQFVAPTPTPGGNNFAGIAFNPTGQIILSTNSALYRLENNLSLTSISTLSVSGAGADLTSCSFPMGVLPVIWKSVTAEIKNDHNALLTWTVVPQNGNEAYYVEHSTDGVHWNQIGVVPAKETGTDTETYSFIQSNPSSGINYYRIRQQDNGGQYTFSDIKVIRGKTNGTVSVWPNPTTDAIHIQSAIAAGKNSGKALVLDLSGRVLNETTLQAGVTTVNVKSLPSGTYLLHVQLADGGVYNQKLVKN